MRLRDLRVVTWLLSGVVALMMLIIMGVSAGAKAGEITVSRRTTFLVSPLRSDGTIDYLRAAEDELGKGATVENNAAIVLLGVIGDNWVRSDGSEDMQRLMASRPRDPEGRLVSLREFAGREDTDREALRASAEELCCRPWRQPDAPVVARWVELNTVPMARIVKGVQRSKFYLPMVPGPGTDGRMFFALLPQMEPVRDIGLLFVCRATLRLATGDDAGAMSDLIVVHRLARLVSWGGSLIHQRVATDLESVALCGEKVMLDVIESIQAADVTKHVVEIEGLPPWMPWTSVIKLERLRALDMLTAVATEGDRVVADFAEGSLKVALTRLRNYGDWDDTLGYVNQRYDDLDGACHESSSIARQIAMYQATRKVPTTASQRRLEVDVLVNVGAEGLYNQHLRRAKCGAELLLLELQFMDR